jgi:hypothetical protein
VGAEISEERFDELNAAWEAATPTERLRLNRTSWFCVGGKGTSYYEHKPSELEQHAATRIAELEATLRTLLKEMRTMAERADLVCDDEAEAMLLAEEVLGK